MRWLREPSAAAVADALRMAVPDLAGLPATIPSLAGQDDPVWQMPAAALGEDYIVKFAWSRAAARLVLHQIRILEMLAVEPGGSLPARGCGSRDQPADPGHQAGARDKLVQGRGRDRP